MYQPEQPCLGMHIWVISYNKMTGSGYLCGRGVVMGPDAASVWVLGQGSILTWVGIIMVFALE